MCISNKALRKFHIFTMKYNQISFNLVPTRPNNSDEYIQTSSPESRKLDLHFYGWLTSRSVGCLIREGSACIYQPVHTLRERRTTRQLQTSCCLLQFNSTRLALDVYYYVPLSSLSNRSVAVITPIVD